MKDEFKHLLLALITRARDELGVQLQVTSSDRTWDEQLQLYHDWRTGKRHAPAAHPDKSMHVIGRAADLRRADGLMIQANVGSLAESLGLRWGGRFRDPEPWHFDLPAPRDTRPPA